MNYPFEFEELLLTDGVLDALGFSKYWGGSGDFGERWLDLGGQPGDEELISNDQYPNYLLRKIDESDDPECGYGKNPKYNASHYVTKNWKVVYFFHELLQDILDWRKIDELKVFIEKARKANMGKYVDDYLNYKTNA